MTQKRIDYRRPDSTHTHLVSSPRGLYPCFLSRRALIGCAWNRGRAPSTAKTTHVGRCFGGKETRPARSNLLSIWGSGRRVPEAKPAAPGFPDPLTLIHCLQPHARLRSRGGPENPLLLHSSTTLEVPAMTLRGKSTQKKNGKHRFACLQFAYSLTDWPQCG